ncbi:MAG: exodeoxyribonuclease VII small subunit [Bacteroidales bacterium]|nr:exodeoxyribonuclease VII small subunit [Bacteroidales bacterium]
MAKKIISYSEAIGEIEGIIEKMDNKELDIDALSENVSRVTELIKICKSKLKTTEEQIEKTLNEIDIED